MVKIIFSFHQSYRNGEKEQPAKVIKEKPGTGGTGCLLPSHNRWEGNESMTE
jgi:hypothetical protein